MARTAAGSQSQGRFDRWVSNRLLAALAGLLGLTALLAVARGQADWQQVPPLVWVHVVTVLAATLLTPVMLLRRKGTRDHRRLGHAWAAAMLVAAVTSLFFNVGGGAGSLGVFSGDFSPIHILSVFVLVAVPSAILKARRHERVAHERSIRGLVIGALLVAGFFTFPFNRMLGAWLFG